MQYMYRLHCKQKYCTTFYRLEICHQSTLVKLCGFTIDKTDELKTRLSIATQLLTTSEEKDLLYESTEHCTEADYNDWLRLYIEIHDTQLLRVIGDKDMAIINDLFS